MTRLIHCYPLYEINGFDFFVIMIDNSSLKIDADLPVNYNKIDIKISIYILFKEWINTTKHTHINNYGVPFQHAFQFKFVSWCVYTHSSTFIVVRFVIVILAIIFICNDSSLSRPRAWASPSFFRYQNT